MIYLGYAGLYLLIGLLFAVAANLFVRIVIDDPEHTKNAFSGASMVFDALFWPLGIGLILVVSLMKVLHLVGLALANYLYARWERKYAERLRKDAELWSVFSTEQEDDTR